MVTEMKQIRFLCQAVYKCLVSLYPQQQQDVTRHRVDNALGLSLRTMRGTNAIGCLLEIGKIRSVYLLLI